MSGTGVRVAYWVIVLIFFTAALVFWLQDRTQDAIVDLLVVIILIQIASLAERK